MKFGLRTRFLVPTVGLIVVGMAISATSSIINARQALGEMATGQVEQVANQASKSLATWLRDRTLDIGTWSEQKIYSTATQTSFLGKAARQAANADLTNLKEKYGYYKNVFLADSSGTLVAGSALDNLAVWNVTEEEFFLQSMEGQSFVSGAQVDSQGDGLVIAVSSPVRKGEGEVSGVLFGLADLDSFSGTFLDDLRVGKTGYACIVGDDGVILAHPDKSRIGQPHAATESLLAQNEGRLVYESDGVERMASFQRNAELGWTVIAEVETAELTAPARRIGYQSVVITAGAVVLATLMVLFVTGSLVRPIKTVADRLRDISEGEGDLTVSLDVKGAEEIEELAEGFNVFVGKIRTLVEVVKDSSIAMAATAEELSLTTSQVADSNGEISSQASAVASASEEMNRTVEMVAENVATVSDVSKEACSVASDGASVVSDALSAMQEIAEIVEETGRSVSALGGKLQNVTVVIEVIEDIADQTNLLALNAAIEAARAGDHGRGFAVVADEVRKLAEKTVKATHEIGDTIGAIQTESEKAVEAVARGAERVAKGTGLGAEASKAIQTMEGQAVRVADQTSQIASAATQLTVTIREIAENTDGMAQFMEQNSHGVDEISKTAETVAHKADEIRTHAERFHT